jgi:hypothetical protein
MKSAALLLVVSLALGACSAATGGDIPKEAALSWAKLGERAYADGTDVTPLEVLEDSRCPADAQCVWAGRVRIRATVHHGSGDVERELESGKPITVAGGKLELVAVHPATSSRKATVPEDYRLGFRFTNRP